VTLHRGVIHQSFHAPRWGTRVGLYLFVLAGMGGPITWIRLHHVRDYWQNHPRCPPYFSYNHSLCTELWWSFHSKYQPKRREERIDLRTIADAQWLRFLEWSWPLHNLLLGGLLYLFGGWGMVLVAGCLRITVSIVGHCTINYAAHTRGSQRYAIHGSPEQGRNIWLLGVISFGEGFHNNHHAYPGSARMGQLWHEFDIGWYVLRCLEACGAVWNLRAFGRTNSGIKSAVQPTPQASSEATPTVRTS